MVNHHVAAIEESSSLYLVALADIDKERALQITPRPEVEIYEDYSQMLEEHPEIDVVAIATPSGLHYPHALNVIRRWRKSVVIEKPPTLKFSEFDTLIDMADGEGVHVFPVFQYRFNTPVQHIREGIRKGELGNPRIVSIRQRWCRTQRYYDQSPWRGTYSLDGGALTNQGIHHLDLIQYLAGPVQEVYAVKATFGSDIEAEDSVVATLIFESGAIGSLEITTATRPEDIESSVSIIGDHGFAILGGWATDKLVAYSPKPEDTVEFSQSNEHAYGLGHHNIYSGVVQTLSGKGQAEVTSEDARKVLELLHALYVSAAERRPVRLDEVLEFAPLGQPNEELWARYKTNTTSS